MIIKLIGGIMIVSSCAFSGYILSEKNKYRIQDIEEMKKAVSFYKGSVSAIGLSAAEAFRETSSRIKGTVKNIFEDAALQTEKRASDSIDEIWRRAVKKNIDNTYFEKDEMNAIYSFGSVLGFMDRQQQNENAEIIIEELETIEKQIREKSIKEEKVYPSVGVLCGLLFSILLF